MNGGAAEKRHGAYPDRGEKRGSGVCSMKIQDKRRASACPVTAASIRVEVRETLDGLVAFCESSDATFYEFEKRLLVLMMALGRLLIRLFLPARHERLDVKPFLSEGY